MTAADYVQQLRSQLANVPVTIQETPLVYANGVYPFVRVASEDLERRDAPIVLIRAGIHGDEVSGPLSVLKYARLMFDYAEKHGVQIILYPLGNPSGYEYGTRYNVDGDRGSAGNNDFLRYEGADGVLLDELPEDAPFARWHWSSDIESVQLPQETRVMQECLKKDPLSRVQAVIDLHQDYITPNAAPSAYHYVFGDTHAYDAIVQQIEALVPIRANTPIDAGQSSLMCTDVRGYIIRHDGTLPDLIYRMGVRYAATSETMGSTPMDVAMQVNAIWMYGMIDLVM